MEYKDLFLKLNRRYIASDCFLQKNNRYQNSFSEVVSKRLVPINVNSVNAQHIAEGITACALASGKRVFMLSCNLYSKLADRGVDNSYSTREFNEAVSHLGLITIVPSESGAAAIYMVKPYSTLWNLIEEKPYFMQDQHVLDSCLTMRRPIFPHDVKVEEVIKLSVENDLCPKPTEDQTNEEPTTIEN